MKELQDPRSYQADDIFSCATCPIGAQDTPTGTKVISPTQDTIGAAKRVSYGYAMGFDWFYIPHYFRFLTANDPWVRSCSSAPGDYILTDTGGVAGHAMVIVGVYHNPNNDKTYLRVRNSWIQIGDGMVIFGWIQILQLIVGWVIFITVHLIVWYIQVILYVQ